MFKAQINTLTIYLQQINFGKHDFMKTEFFHFKIKNMKHTQNQAEVNVFTLNQIFHLKLNIAFTFKVKTRRRMSSLRNESETETWFNNLFSFNHPKDRSQVPALLKIHNRLSSLPIIFC